MARIVINADLPGERISRHIYGHFAEHLGRCIYDGFWVGEDSDIPNTRGIRSDIVDALRCVQIPNLRWPGGCFADDYHWMDGIGPRGDRPPMLNSHWGGVTENNHFGTHEFLDLCEQLGCEPYICGNVGSGTVREMQQWVEYIACEAKSPMADLRREHGREEPWRVKFWGVGNENWGCGGNMRPERYSDEFRRFATFLHDYGENRLYRIACGPSGGDYDWTEVLMRERGRRTRMAGLALHYYTGFRGEGYAATEFGEPEWFAVLERALAIDGLMRRHSAIMDHHDPEGKVDLVVDEWGTWYVTEPGTNPAFLYQQNSLRDALVAGVTFDAFNRHCRRVTMGNIAQTVNVLQSMVLTEGARMVLTPTYHVFDLYKAHHDAVRVPMDVKCEPYSHGGRSIPGVSGTASRDGQGRLHLTLCHLHPHESVSVACEVRGMAPSAVSGRVLTADDVAAHNTFDEPDRVKPTDFGASRLERGVLSVDLPAKSIVALEIE